MSGLAPKRWTPADPHLYRMEVTLRDAGGALLDRVTHHVGFRTFEVRGNRLFLVEVPVQIAFPEIGVARQRLEMITRLVHDDVELSRTVDGMALRLRTPTRCW